MEKISELLNQERNRQKSGFRLWEGIKSIFLPPFSGLIPVSILTLLFYVCLSNRTLVFSTNMSGMRYKIFDYIIIAVLVFVFLTFLLALLARLGTPKNSMTAENAAIRAFKLQSTPSECPILISSKLVTLGSTRWEFYSKWITMKEWQDSIDYILTPLNCFLLGKIKYGGRDKNNSNRIVFYTRPGAKPIARDVLTDEEI